MSTTEKAVCIKGLAKSFGSHEVLKGLSLQVSKGSIFALLGANGAGKTTLINILTTLSRADAGQAIVAGYDVQASPNSVRKAITVTGQQVTVDTVLTGYENLLLVGKLRHIPDPTATARELLERFELVEAGSKPVGTYSGGMQRRLDIALSLLGDPEIVFLDEPTTGLDPAARREVWSTIQKLAQSGITIFLTTQYMEEAEHLADTIAVLHDGHVLVAGDTKTILEAAGDTDNLEDAFLALTSKDASTRQLLLELRSETAASEDLDCAALKRNPQAIKHHFVKDTWTFAARMLKHNIRSADTIMTVLGMPLMILLLFVFVFGGAMDTGTIAYIDYIVPAVLLMCIASGVSYTAFRVKGDILSGIFDRFRTMPIAHLSFVGGHVLASVIVNGISCVALFLVALLLGYRPQADIAGWGIALGVLLFTLVAFATIGVTFGIIAKTSEGSGMFSYLIIGLLFVSSGFAPTASMPPALQVFAKYQPMTPIINTMRSALLGDAVGYEVWIALAWLLLFTLVFSFISLSRVKRLSDR